jgi:hypothetical protein
MGTFDISIDLSAEDTPPGGGLTGEIIATLTPVDEDGNLKTQWLDTDETITYRVDLEFTGDTSESIGDVFVNAQPVTLSNGLASLTLGITPEQLHHSTYLGQEGLYPEFQGAIDIQSPSERVLGIQIQYGGAVVIKPTVRVTVTLLDDESQPASEVVTETTVNARVVAEFTSEPFAFTVHYQSVPGADDSVVYFDGVGITCYISGNPGAEQAIYLEVSSTEGEITEVVVEPVTIIEPPAPEEV